MYEDVWTAGEVADDFEQADDFSEALDAGDEKEELIAERVAAQLKARKPRTVSIKPRDNWEPLDTRRKGQDLDNKDLIQDTIVVKSMDPLVVHKANI